MKMYTNASTSLTIWTIRTWWTLHKYSALNAISNGYPCYMQDIGEVNNIVRP